MPKSLQIVILICVPLAWGLAVEFLFSRVVRHRQSAGPVEGRETNDIPD